MKKFVFTFLSLIICIFLVSCNKEYYKVEIHDGKQYKNIKLELEYVSEDSVNIILSGDVLQKTFGEDYYVDVLVILVSNDTIIATEKFQLYAELDGLMYKRHVKKIKEVELNYYNYDSITAYVDGVEAYYLEKK